MPCACRVPVTQYPETAEWGPLMWDILHAFAERSGKIENPLIQQDERRHLLFLIEGVEKTIPCEICKAHYKEYLDQHPVKDILTMPYEDLRPFVQKWFWNLHNEINLGNNKPVFAYSGLSHYQSINIKVRLEQLAAPIQRAMTHNGVKLLNWKAFEREVRTLIGLI